MLKKYSLPPVAARMQFINKYITDVRSETGYYWGYIENRAAGLIDGVDLYNMLLYDERVADCSSHSALKSCGFEVEITSDIPILKHLLDQQTTNIKGFLHNRKSILEKSMLFGTGILRKSYNEVYDPKVGVTWELINKMIEVDIRRLFLEREIMQNGYRTPPYWTLWHPKYDKYIKLEDRKCNPCVELGAGLQDYVWLMYNYEELESYFMGFGQILTQLIYVKNELKKYWSSLAAYWSKPFIIVKVDLNQFNVDATFDGINQIADQVEAAKASFKKRTSDNIIICDDNQTVEIKEMGAIGQNIIKDYIDYIDTAIDRLFYSSTLTTDTDGKGSYALGDIHQSEANMNFKYNNARLCETLKYQLYLDTVYRNQPQLMQLGVDVNTITINDFKVKLI